MKTKNKKTKIETLDVYLEGWRQATCDLITDEKVMTAFLEIKKQQYELLK